MMSSPTAFEPVKAMTEMRGSRTSAAPVVSPGAGQNWIASAGAPISWSAMEMMS